MKTSFIYIAALGLALLYACGSPAGKELDTATTGNINMTFDETFRPLADAELQAFHGIYKRAHITPSFKPEAEAIHDLLTDSARSVMVSRTLTPEENKVFEQKKITIRPIKIAEDGIAIVLHPGNPLEGLTVTELKAVLTGQRTAWSELPKSTLTDGILVVFDNQNSSTVRYLTDSLLGKQPMSGKTFAARSNQEVVDYVAQNKNALGVIGVSWISDTDDSTSASFLKKIKVAAIADDRNGKKGEYVQPYQAYLATKEYPLRRALYLVSREARAGLATGFASFAASERGQRIVLKSGLLPATMPIRLVQFGDSKKLGR